MWQSKSERTGIALFMGASLLEPQMFDAVPT